MIKYIGNENRKNVVMLPVGDDSSDTRYTKIDDYGYFIVYQETAPNGRKVPQSWALESEETGVFTVIQPFNRVSKKELYDMIDYFEESEGYLGVKAFDVSSNGYDIYVVNPHGFVSI